MTIEIRRALHADATKIIKAHQRSIREICSKDYPPEQIEAWAGRDFREDRWHQTMDKDFVWVISDLELNVYGFGHLQIRENAEAEIAGLYFAPEVTGKGFGKKLMAMILDECRNKEIKTIYLTATKTAKSFYQRAGFQQAGEARLIALGGQKIECFDMTMTKF